MKLNLGCGFNKINGFINVDVFTHCNPDIIHDLEIFPYPFEVNSIDEILFNHSLEHIGQNSNIFLKIIKEIYRVCKDGALIQINVPHPRHDNFISDPTHVRAITPMTLKLFDLELNHFWQANKFANSPLAIYLGVNFKLIKTTTIVEEKYVKMLRDNIISDEDLNILISERNNVAIDYNFTWKVIKKLV